ncbi:FAD-dependent oxidoreductase [Serratia sp. Lou2A]|jgi:sarcosine oxidase|uniref:FAD-dependent oxidoreductase n=1 Tax=Serratia montpellierensis TaxID=2598730 RepID=A0ABS8J2K1_9GAMM|nr:MULTISPECIES: FAD-dependent oxidoreductase [Serratia]MBH2562421.1 FAD-dependent oxidoreductase [Serratia marcescens]MBH3105165.1 FAD-dependent oxidoreductase [Serratia marcescens]MBH3200636.1 FAD-dependent oxidoreductase [Serratia marcescens]MBI6122525.1 FAD-dependent oxidoreductase [Serratia marcescens]MCC7584300.1 FAD-dependent oxidoreductase [Serratia sp. Lou2A]
MHTSVHWDVIIIGAGPIGLAAAWNYAREHQDHKILVLEQYALFTQLAGTSGEERHWRLQYSELEIFRLTLEADKLWRQLEQQADRKLIHRIGSLWFGDADVWTNEGQIRQTMLSMDEMRLPYERLTMREIERRYGFTGLDSNYEGFLQQDGGVIDVKGTLTSLYSLASEAGVEFQFQQCVKAVEPDARGATVLTAQHRYRARKVLVAGGPGSKKLLRQLDIDLALSTYEMACISMLRSQRLGANDPFWFAFQPPVESDSNLFYGFPPNPWSVNGFDRLGTDFEVDPITEANAPSYRANPQHVERALEFARRHMPFLEPDKQHSAASCLAVLPTDPARQFYLDSAKGRCHGGEHLVVSAGGWAFKFTPLMGQICADLLAEREPRWDISALRF